jgi:hypothetical protein
MAELKPGAGRPLSFGVARGVAPASASARRQGPWPGAGVASCPSPRAGEALAPARGQVRLQIDALRIALPGVTAAAARRISQRALELAAERLPPNLGGRRLNGIRLQIQSRTGSERELSLAIAEALVQAVRQQG